MTLSPTTNAGFTLIEVLAAVVIMMIGLLGMLQAINVAVAHDIRNQLRDEAISIGEDQMNDLRLKGYSTNGYHKSVALVTRNIRGIVKEFKVEKESTTLDDPKAKKLSVSVQWCYKNISATHYLHTVSR